MTWRTRFAVAAGLAAVVAGLALAVTEPAPLRPSESPSTTILAGIGMLLVAGYLRWRTRARRTRADPGAPAAPWTGDGAMLDHAPERTAPAETLAGDALARQIEAACRVADEDGAVEAGLATVRPTLRAATRDVLVAAGSSPPVATAKIDGGEWTDDLVAASVLSRAVAPPAPSLRERFRAWLFPERVVRRRVARAVAAIDRAAAALPAVPGQDAPRTKPVAPPRLETLEVGPDDSLRRGAVDDSSVATDGSPPPGDGSTLPTDEQATRADEPTVSPAGRSTPAGGRATPAPGPDDGREEQ